MMKRIFAGWRLRLIRPTWSTSWRRPDKRSAIGQLALCLFALILISPAVNAQQLLTGRFNGKTQSLLVMLNADDKKITLAGLSSVGIRLFLVTYDDKGLHTEQSIVVPQLPPASQVLADVMLSHWPISAWQPQLPKGWTLTDNGNTRELRNARGKLVTEISYLNRKGKREPIGIEQHVFKYHITIQYLGD